MPVSLSSAPLAHGGGGAGAVSCMSSPSASFGSYITLMISIPFVAFGESPTLKKMCINVCPPSHVSAKFNGRLSLTRSFTFKRKRPLPIGPFSLSTKLPNVFVCPMSSALLGTLNPVPSKIWSEWAGSPFAGTHWVFTPTVRLLYFEVSVFPGS